MWLIQFVLQVLTEPKNALGKQYKKMFQMNGVSYHLFHYRSFLRTGPVCGAVERSEIVEKREFQFLMYVVLVSQVKLHFTDDALRLIARKAVSKNTGARGLRSMLENVLMDAMYEVCDSSPA